LTATALASWNDRQAKQAILGFVASVSADGPDFVEPVDRIATLENTARCWWSSHHHDVAGCSLNAASEAGRRRPD
jgi:hypothetical protein